MPTPAIFMTPVGCAIAAAPVLELELAVPVDLESVFVLLALALMEVDSGFTPVEVVEPEPEPVLLDFRAMAGSWPLVAFAVVEGFVVPVLVDLPDLLVAVVFASVFAGVLELVTSGRSCATSLEVLLSAWTSFLLLIMLAWAR